MGRKTIIKIELPEQDSFYEGECTDKEHLFKVIAQMMQNTKIKVNYGAKEFEMRFRSWGSKQEVITSATIPAGTLSTGNTNPREWVPTLHTVSIWLSQLITEYSLHDPSFVALHMPWNDSAAVGLRKGVTVKGIWQVSNLTRNSYHILPDEFATALTLAEQKRYADIFRKLPVVEKDARILPTTKLCICKYKPTLHSWQYFIRKYTKGMRFAKEGELIAQMYVYAKELIAKAEAVAVV